jgi:hypothetical protein
MSLIRTAFWLSLIIMLMPTDQSGQEKVAASAGQAAERAATFCERNPSTCAAGSELWATFLRKAEFSLHLAASTARDYINRKGKAEPAADTRSQPAAPLPPAFPAATQPASAIPRSGDGAPASRSPGQQARAAG